MNEDTITQMQAQIEMLTKLLGAKGNDSDNINSYIEFESMSLSPLYLSTNGDGKGEVYAFDNFGEIQNIPIIDAREIVRNNKSFVQEGLVYINNKDFIEKENLNRHYEKIISVEEMNKLLLCKRVSFGEKYSKLTKTQQETVCGMLLDKIKNDEKVDDEILYYLAQYSNKDLKSEAAQLQLLMNNEEE